MPPVSLAPPSLHPSFPEPIMHLCRPTVLVESFEHGEMLSSFLGKNYRGSKRFRRKLASVGMTAFLKMILVDNYTHADLHPGNIMVTTVEGGDTPLAEQAFTDESTPKLVFLDVGIITELSTKDK
jgi:aarF domain-containing kinase